MAKAVKPPQPKLTEIMNISISSITPSKSNPRQDFDKEGIKDLSDSMAAVGLIQPITLRPGKKDGFEIVAGERRYRAAKLLKWETIAAIVKDISDDEMLEIQIIENLQREDVSPLDEAHAFKTLLKKENIEWLASKIHKTKKYIIDRLKLNDLAEEVADQVRKGVLPLGHAVVLSKLSFADQMQCLEKCIDNGFGENTDDEYCKMPLEELKDFIADDIMLNFERVSFDPKDATLYPDAGACSNCPKRTCNSQLLFNDITKEDKCTDKACFHEKLNLHVARQKEKAKEEYGKVLSGEPDLYNSNTVKVQGVKVKFSETPVKNAVPVVITKTDRSHKNDLGKTVYVDSKLLDKVKVEKVERKSGNGQDSGPQLSYGEKLKKNFREYEFPLLQLISNLSQNKLVNEITIREFFREKLDCINDRWILSLAGLIGLHAHIDDANMAYDFADEDHGFEFRKKMIDGIIDHFGFEKMPSLIISLEAIKFIDAADDLDEFEEFGFTWKKVNEILKIEPKQPDKAPEKKAVKK